AIGTAIKSDSSSEPSVRYSVLTPTRASSGSTGSPVRIELPKLPWSTFHSHAPYRPYQDCGTPSASRAAACARGDCPSSRRLSGSPGARYSTAKTTMLTPSSSSAVTASSRRSTRATGRIAESFTSLARLLPLSLLLGRGNEPLVGEREELVRMDLDAAQLAVVRAVVRERPQEGVRLLLGEDGVQLAVDRAALLEVQRELALDDQRVHLGVGVAAEVVLPVADLGGLEHRRDAGRVVEPPGGEHDVEVVLEEHVLLPSLPFLELDVDRDADGLEVVLEREHDALHRLALLLDRDLEREDELLAVLFHDAVGALLPAGLGEERARLVRIERQRLDVEVVRPAPRRERPGDERALAVEEGAQHLLPVDRLCDRLAHALVREDRVANVVAEER